MEIIAVAVVGWLLLNVGLVLLRMRAIAPRTAAPTVAAPGPGVLPVVRIPRARQPAAVAEPLASP